MIVTDFNPLEWKAPIMDFLLWVSWVVMSYHNQKKSNWDKPKSVSLQKQQVLLYTEISLFSFSLTLMILSVLHQVLKGLCHRMCPVSSSLLSILMLFPVSTTLGVYSDVCQLCISPVPPVDTSSEGPSKITTPLHLQKVFLRNKWPGFLHHTINCITRFSHLL